MLQTYKAILRGNRLEWSDEVPEPAQSEQPVEVQVTILQETAASTKQEAQGKRMAEALEKLAAMNALSDITDPSAWQREQRLDRPLPGREV
jgi:hypothetical protein